MAKIIDLDKVRAGVTAESDPVPEPEPIGWDGACLVDYVCNGPNDGICTVDYACGPNFDGACLLKDCVCGNLHLN